MHAAVGSSLVGWVVAAGLLACAPPRPRLDSCEPIREPEPGAVDAGSPVAVEPLEGPSDAGRPVPTESDDHAGDVTVEVHERVATILVVRWTQRVAAEAWLEFEVDGELRRSPKEPRAPGAQREVVLGVPSETEVDVRVVSRVGDLEFASAPERATTGRLPAGLPRPTVFRHEPSKTSPERFLFGSVENSPGGSGSGYYYGTFWLYILDRKGRILWYYADPSSNATSSFQRIARDGEYLWIEKRAYNGTGSQSVVKTTLDGEYFEEIPVPGLSDCIDVTDDGSLLYDRDGELHELDATGEDRVIWSCRRQFGPGFECYTNTVNWFAAQDSVLLSFPYQNVVVEVDRSDGRLLARYGAGSGSHGFAPPRRKPPEAWAFSFQHFPNRTPQGTLLVSSHIPGCHYESAPGAFRHAFIEFEIERETRELREVWRYVGREWPKAKGMAVRLSNGNTLVNFGTGGVIREVTPEGRTVFGVKFDVAEGNDFYNKMVGHNVFIDDLYALNGGPR